MRALDDADRHDLRPQSEPSATSTRRRDAAIETPWNEREIQRKGIDSVDTEIDATMTT